MIELMRGRTEELAAGDGYFRKLSDTQRLEPFQAHS